MTTTNFLRDRQMETQFQKAVIEYAKTCGWGWPNPDDPDRYEGIWHNPDSRRDNAGLFDIIMLHPEQHRLAFIEVKKLGGKLSGPQKRAWAQLLVTDAEVYVWWPEDWDQIERVLRGG